MASTKETASSSPQKATASFATINSLLPHSCYQMEDATKQFPDANPNSHLFAFIACQDFNFITTNAFSQTLLLRR
jgi:hypothetical protein